MADEAAQPVGVPDVALRAALEFAMKVAVGNSRKKPPVPVPARLRPLLAHSRLRPAGLRTVREVLETDEVFRGEVAGRATVDHVDEIGRLWLQRPEGWGDRVADLLGDAEGPTSVAAPAPVSASAEARRRAAVEKKLGKVELERDRARDDLARAERRLGELTTERDGLAEQVKALTAQLHRERDRNRHRERAAAAERPDDVDQQVTALRRRLDEAEREREELVDRLAGQSDPVNLDELRDLLARATRLVGAGPARAAERTPIAVPSGRLGDDAATAEHYLGTRHVVVLVDGYNVSKHAWPDLPLSQQRDRLVDLCEQLAGRFASRFRVVFDGQDLTGAHTTSRRRVDVIFTSTGETADDRLVELVRGIDTAVPVVVVTSDAAVRRNVQKLGANLLKNHVLPGLVSR